MGRSESLSDHGEIMFNEPRYVFHRSLTSVLIAQWKKKNKKPWRKQTNCFYPWKIGGAEHSEKYDLRYNWIL